MLSASYSQQEEAVIFCVSRDGSLPPKSLSLSHKTTFSLATLKTHLDPIYKTSILQLHEFRWGVTVQDTLNVQILKRLFV